MKKNINLKKNVTRKRSYLENIQENNFSLESNNTSKTYIFKFKFQKIL